ncbi:uncharacterized protein LOC110835465 isoform X2 [Zootermopsis nevadensis]|uniref:Pro-resilin n=2 Tax=Zootermopsis nevadensis TaxID=136037 RepID=A0A067R5H3_ZOONE|nr:uncharacterized protein LOC110835465 isoform X2 [Zootermopsis nevadensis]KDR13357.1 Pro-resilin [Zootermopsis nevadensis]
MTLCSATPPAGYLKKPDNDKDPPKYEFGYHVRDGKGGRQGHLETRDGIYALGLYYVTLPDGSGQSVRYFADDWGYHPLVSYTSSTKTGSTKTHFALGEKAVAALARSKESNSLISATRPTASTVKNSVLKLSNGVGSGDSDTGNSQKIIPGSVDLSSNRVVKPGSKSSSYQHASQPSEHQVDVSDINNIVDSNGGSENGEYEVVTPLYSPSQRLTSSGSPSSFLTSEQTSNYEPGQEFQQISTKGVGSYSYQLIEIGGDSSGNKVSGSLSTVFLPLSSKTVNTESVNSSRDENGNNFKVTSHVNNKNIALQFGDKIPNVGSAFIQTVSSVDQDQNDIYKEKEYIFKDTSPPAPQRHSVLRPIIVAEIYPKERDKETIQSVRPIVILPSTTAATIHASHFPESTSSISLPGSGEAQSGSIVSKKLKAIDEYSTPSNTLLHSQDGSLSYSSGSESISQSLGSVNNDRLAGHIVSQVYSTPKPVLLSHIKQTTASVSSSGLEGSSSESASFADGRHTAHAEPLVHTTPVPVFLSYSHGSSNAQQNVSPLVVLYPPASSYSHISSSTRSGTNGDVITGVYSTPTPVSLLQSQEFSSYASNRSEEYPQKEYTTTTDNGDSQRVIESQPSNPTSVYISHSPKSSSFSVSDSGGSSQVSSSITATSNGNSGHISGSGIFSATSRPPVESNSNSELSLSGHISSPAILLNLNSQPISTTLTSSINVLAPIQAGVSSGLKPHQQLTAVSDVPSTPEATPQPPKVKEDIDDIPQTNTVVEVEKAVLLDFNKLLLKPDGENKENVGVPASAVPTANAQQVTESRKQVDQISDQQQIFSGNPIEYVYGQPLTGLQAYPQIGYSLPRLIGSTEQLLYGYNLPNFDVQKPTHFSYNPKQQFHSGVELQAPYQQSSEKGKEKQQEEEYAHKQANGLLQTIPEYQQQVTEFEKVRGKYQHDQRLKIQLEDVSQSRLQNGVNNKQLAGGGRHIFGQQLPGVTQAESGYSQRPVQPETEVKQYQAPEQISQEITYQQPLEIRQQTQYQSPTEINQQVLYQPLGQQIGYQLPIEFNQQIEFLVPTKLNQPIQQAVNTVGVQSSYNQHTNILPELTQQTTPTSTQALEVSSQTINLGQPSYNRKPDQEYNHQLLEEEMQEKVRFSNQISKDLKQLHVDYNEGSVRTQVPVNTLKEEKILSLPVEYPALPPPAVVHLNRPQAVLKVEKSKSTDNTRLITVVKPVPVHHTKVVEKPIPVPHAVPVEVTKLVPVERPVPYPHPVPVPYAVPHPIEVPVPHLVPYPHIVPVPYKELHPVFFRNDKPYKNDLSLYHYQVQNFPSSTPLPVILKTLQYNGGRYGVPVSIKPQHFHPSPVPQPVYLTPPPLKVSGRGRELQQTKNLDHFRTLCVEYGFKPPLVPSVQIYDVPPSAYGPPKKD